MSLAPPAGLKTIRTVHTNEPYCISSLQYLKRSGRPCPHAAGVRCIAGHLLEAAANDVEFADGSFVVAGTDRRVSFAEVARAAYVPHNFPLETLEPGLQETAVYDPPSFAFSNGAHVCELEIDPQTGRIEIVGFWGVDDVGTVINPMIVEGQIQGGLTEGFAIAAMELITFDESGNCIGSNFMDYLLPTAWETPKFELFETVTPSPHHPIGAKGVGESATVGSPAR